jgi:hypothetical protein
MNILLSKLVKDDKIIVFDDVFSIDVLKSLQCISMNRFYRDHSAKYPGLVADLSILEVSALKVYLRDIFNFEIERCHIRLRQLNSENIRDDKTFIHTDQNCLIAIIYIDVTDPIDWETNFYFHKVTRKKKQSFELGNRQTLVDDIVLRNHHRDLSQWECWHKIDPVVNRLVLFDGHLYHSGPLGHRESSLSLRTERRTLEIFLKRDTLLMSKLLLE